MKDYRVIVGKNRFQDISTMIAWCIKNVEPSANEVHMKGFGITWFDFENLNDAIEFLEEFDILIGGGDFQELKNEV